MTSANADQLSLTEIIADMHERRDIDRQALLRLVANAANIPCTEAMQHTVMRGRWPDQLKKPLRLIFQLMKDNHIYHVNNRLKIVCGEGEYKIHTHPLAGFQKNLQATRARRNTLAP